MEGQPGKQKKSYSEEFKREGGHPQAQVARDLGVCRSLLGKWRRIGEEALSIRNGDSGSPRAFPGHGNPRDEELVPLQRENARLKEEVETLKKAVGIFTSRPR